MKILGNVRKLSLQIAMFQFQRAIFLKISIFKHIYLKTLSISNFQTFPQQVFEKCRKIVEKQQNWVL